MTGVYAKPNMRDEQAEHEAFEELVGGPERGFRLMRMWQSTANPSTYEILSESEKAKLRLRNFRIRADREGYSAEQIDSFLALQ